MTSAPIARAKRCNGFTLAELLVSIAVLSLIVVGMATMTGYISKAWLSGLNAADNFSKAETMLSVMDRDIQMMVMRRNVAAFADATGNPSCAFYTNLAGYPGTDTRAISLVQYILNTSTGSSSNPAYTLDRNEYGMNYTASGASSMPIAVVASGALPQLTQLSSPNLQTEPLATGVIAFQWQFIDGAGNILTPPYLLSSTPPSTSQGAPASATPFWFDYANQGGSYNPRVVVISMVVLSNQAYKIASLQGSLSTLAGCFSTTPPVNQAYSKTWNNFLASPNSTFLSLPQPIRDAGAIEIIVRHIPLPLTTPTS